MKNKGFTLFIAIVVMGTLLLIASGVINLALKQSYISNAGRESQIAFYAADTGMECALYWDVKNPSGHSAFSTSTGALINCNQDSANPDNEWVVGGATVSTINHITFLPSPACTIVTVTKNSNGTTEIETFGYNTCDTTNPRRVERAIRTTYGVEESSYPPPPELCTDPSASNYGQPLPCNYPPPPPSPYSIEYLVVGGGGGGGYGGVDWVGGAGGGGGGGVVSGSMTATPDVGMAITVGFGGSASNNGGTSLINGVASAVGGGGGGSNPHGSGKTGGAGGGAVGIGVAGGGSVGYAGGINGGGGGGMGGAGGNGDGTLNPGAGGPGTASSVSGSSVVYAGGGGGNSWSGAAGGSGGGGAAADSRTGAEVYATAGTPNTGGGGGAGAGTGIFTSQHTPGYEAGGSGGSGIVIIRYAGAQRGTGGTITSSGGYTIHTFYSSGTFTP